MSDVNMDMQDWKVASGAFCDHGVEDGNPCDQCEERFTAEEEMEYNLYFDEEEAKWEARRDLYWDRKYEERVMGEEF